MSVDAGERSGTGNAIDAGQQSGYQSKGELSLPDRVTEPVRKAWHRFKSNHAKMIEGSVALRRVGLHGRQRVVGANQILASPSRG
jgi:hypothetical protein